MVLGITWPPCSGSEEENDGSDEEHELEVDWPVVEEEALETARLLDVNGTQPTTLAEALDVIEALRTRLRKQSQDDSACSIDAYFEMSICSHLKQRLPWLMVLLLLESVSAYSMGRFESMLDRHMTLALFCPMIVGTAGNAGNQPGVIFTRAVTTGQLDAGDKMARFFRRESLLAVIVSGSMSLLALCRTTADHGQDLLSCIAISVAIFFIIMFAIGIGIGFSLLLHRCGCDPAAGAAPLLTTLSDVVGVLLLCLVSSLIFQAYGKQFVSA
eukprot:gnl/TRDRNA2_/TRDRNA2_133938_c0_seq2.p1 gnl/TRDRNA2_/TRDRNA2_133938_c0~~gnl/TRDRNA2_/TRDRNA2_133938_c0_seq2.p1  ORF type:complete len:271 (+),score=44.03 gnl/TRDRNA2_/TRDRNA2_133938_c0_seq2:58-870(+)